MSETSLELNDVLAAANLALFAFRDRHHPAMLFLHIYCINDRMNGVEDWGRYAAAGDGTDWPEYPEKEEVILFDSPMVARADEIITVTGKSMEPQFHDGDRVLVEHCVDLRNGDIGIFYVPGMGGMIKQKAYDRLHSINQDYDDIFPYEEGATVIGRVLGKIEKDMIPSMEE